MKNILPVRLGIIQKTILVLAIFMMSVVWPLGAFPVSHISTCEWDGMRISGPSNENEYVRQEFSPNFEQLKSISVYVANDPDSIDTMKAVLRVYDYTGNCLSENYFQLEDYMLPGYVTVPVGLKLTPGTLYFYTIGGVDGDVIVAYCNDEAKTAENGAFFYKEVPSGGTSIVTQYEYERPMGLKRILICDFAIALGAVLLIGLVGWAKSNVFRKCSEDKAIALWRRTENTVRYAIVAVALIGIIIGFAGIVIGKLFTNDYVNIIVLFLGVVIAAAYICYGVLTCKSELEPQTEGERALCTKGIAIIRALLFAITVIMCCMYQNGYTDYEKGLYLRKIIIFFGLFMISLGKRRWIWNIGNVLWSVVAVVFGRYYISLHSDHIEHINTATNNAWVIWVMGLIVIQIIYRVVKGAWRKLKNISIPYFCLTLLFWAGCIIFANGRQWPALVCALMPVWIFFYATSDNREQILENICNGILMAFAGGIIFCLYRRPYQYFMLTRYGGIFFTATVTATYYLLPAAAALVKLIAAIKENDKRKTVLNSCAFGIVAAYMAFTASRTGIIAMAAMVLYAFVIPVIKAKKNIIINQIKGFAVLTVSIIITFIMSFSATRMLPAMSGNPFYFWYEEPNAYFAADTPWNGGTELSETYIDIQMTLKMLFGRLLSVGDLDASARTEPSEIRMGPLYASTKPSVNLELSEATSQYANGRLEIYKAYFEQLNMIGHESSSAVADNGEVLVHAHNSYLQVAFDFGIGLGIIFLIVCLVTFIRSCVSVSKSGQNDKYSYLMPLVVVGFGVASLFEWLYHIANPLGLVFLLMFAPLMMKRK